MRILLSSLCLIMAFALAAQDQEKQQGISNAEISQLMADKKIPGLAVAKINNAEVSFVGVYGHADVVNKREVTQNTLFSIASISKPIMGITLLQLVDNKQLELDKDINEYLPFKINNPNTENEVITLRHLATHTSGVADYYEPSSFSENSDSPVSLQQHLKSLLTEDGSNYDDGKNYLGHLPGEERKYSNLGAGLAGYLVQRVTKTSLSQYSQSTLFKSLGMSETSWLLKGLDFNKLAVPYSISDVGEFIANPHFGNPQYPDGGIRASIDDMAKLMVGILQNKDASGQKLLSEASYNDMLSLQLPADISKKQRFFWSDNAMGLTGHMGSDIGTFSAFYFEPHSRDGLIILMNVDMNNDTISAMQNLAIKLMSIKS